MPRFRESGKLRAINQLRGQLGYKPYAEFSKETNDDLQRMIIGNTAQKATLEMLRQQGREGDMLIDNYGLQYVGGDTGRSMYEAANLNRDAQHTGSFSQYDVNGNPMGEKVVSTADKTIVDQNQKNKIGANVPYPIGAGVKVSPSDEQANVAAPQLLPHDMQATDPIQVNSATANVPKANLDFITDPLGALVKKYPWLGEKMSTNYPLDRSEMLYGDTGVRRDTTQYTSVPISQNAGYSSIPTNEQFDLARSKEFLQMMKPDYFLTQLPAAKSELRDDSDILRQYDEFGNERILDRLKDRPSTYLQNSIDYRTDPLDKFIQRRPSSVEYIPIIHGQKDSMNDGKPQKKTDKKALADEVQKNKEMWENSPFGKQFNQGNSKKEGK